MGVAQKAIDRLSHACNRFATITGGIYIKYAIVLQLLQFETISNTMHNFRNRLFVNNNQLL